MNGKTSRRKRAYNWNHHNEDFVNGVGTERSSCRARYQQSSVDVYAKFIAVDQVNQLERKWNINQKLNVKLNFFRILVVSAI